MTEKTTEQKILQIARQEFIKTGLGGARMQKIAQLAGVNKALLHYYFRSKEKLYEAALKEISFTFWSAVESHLSNQTESENVQDFLRSIIPTFFNIMSSNPDFPKMTMREIADGGQMIPLIADNLFNRFGKLPSILNEIIKREVEQGKMYPINPLHVLVNIIGMCIISFLMQPIAAAALSKFGRPVDFDQNFYQERINAILEMTFHGLFKQEHIHE